MHSPKFSRFNVSKTPYKVVNDQEIPLYVLLPKTFITGHAPIFVHFHGGFLITGSAIFPDWVNHYILDYQVLHNAIVIFADYRLLPESNGLDILSDVGDVWKWVTNDLPAYLKSIGSQVIPDYNHIMVFGDSAGGYLALQSGLVRRDIVKAVIAAYPMIYLDSPWYSVASTDKSPFGSPQVPRSVLQEHLSRIEEGKIVTSAFPPERLDIALVTLQTGRFVEFVGKDDSIYLDRVLDKVGKGEKGPFLFAFHGKGDTAVPIEQTEEWVKVWKEKFGEESALAAFEEGDHGFDGDARLETEWVKKGLEGVTKAWLG